MKALLEGVGRDLRRGLAADRAELLDLARATAELAWARGRLAVLPSRALLEKSYGRDSRDGPPLSAHERLLVERVGLAVRRMGARLPWKTSCLVQALAAQRWLGRHRIPTELTIGVRKPSLSELNAHAWLTSGDAIITGGDIVGYQPLITADGMQLCRHPTPAS